MTDRIAIIGGGWYGCHIGASLRALGFDITLFERSARLLHEASGNNQFRLHLGFHYPRHHSTRIQSRDGFSRFIERYPYLTAEVPENIYAVARDESLLDFETYRLVMTTSGVDFTESQNLSVKLTNIDGAILVKERVVLLARSRAYFADLLSSNLVLDHTVREVSQDEHGVSIDGQRFDYAIDATWGHLSRPQIDVYYEPTLLLYYEGPEGFPAITLVDGALCSLYPTEDRRAYTLSSVQFTPLGRFETPEEARRCSASATSELIQQKRRQMEDQISRYLPEFRDTFQFLGPQLAVKTKPVGQYSDRSCYVFRNGRIISVMSGKIDTVFFSTEKILSMIEHDHNMYAHIPSDIREDLFGFKARFS